MSWISVGQKIRHFEIVDVIGGGGMGEVFKARDLHLRRLIALKAMKQGLMAPSARERFFHEARVASSLNHPNIVTIFDAFTEEGVDFIAMELIAGKTLEAALAGGALSQAEALKYGLQIADALNAANRVGVVHRDLKPANIMLTEDRVIKVLDFGLAKRPFGDQAGDGDTVSLAALDSCETTPGTIVGTPAYMSPEQAEGAAVDARSDIFSFGAILYEMLSGRRAFQGDSGVSTLIAVVTKEPIPLADLSPDVSEPLRAIVSRCFHKDAERRFQTAADLRAALQDVVDGPIATARVVPPAAPARRRPGMRWMWAAMIVVIAVLAGALVYRSWNAAGSGGRASVVPTAIPLTALPGSENNPSFSPDGNQVTFSWDGDGDNSDIYVKLVGPGRPVRITTDPHPDICPSWSRDGRSIAFLRQLSDNHSALIVIPALGGRERTLLDLETSYILGASKPAWSNDSKWLLISATVPGRGLQGLARVSVETGQFFWMTQPDTASGLNDVMPALSPNGRLLAFSRVGGGFLTTAFVMPVSDVLVPAGPPKALDSGRISALTPEWLDDSTLIVATGGVQSALWKISASGGAPAQALIVPGWDIVQPAVQPGGHRIAYVSKSQDTNIWTLDLASRAQAEGSPKRIITSTQSDVNPQVSPDGKRVAFSSNRSGAYEIWIWEANAPDAFQLTTMGAGTTGSPRWSPSGREIAFDSNVGGRSNVYVVNSDGGKPRKLTESAGANMVPCWSKDGKSIFFGSSRSGTLQIWKMDADGSRPVMITKQGGFAPLVSASGESLYYAKSPASASDIWTVPASGGAERKIADGVYRYSFAPGPEGLYFVTAPGFQRPSIIRYLEFSSEKVSNVLQLSDPPDLGLGLSPDYRHLFFAKIDHRDSDIMLVENAH